MMQANTQNSIQQQQLFPSVYTGEDQENQNNEQQQQYTIKDNKQNSGLFTNNQSGPKRISSNLMAKPDNLQLTSKKYGIFLYYQIEGRAEDDYLQLQLDLHKQFTVTDTIFFAINAFNQSLKEKKLPFTLSNEKIDFTLHISKKSGKPKTDYPALDSDSLISECNRILFTLVPKNQEKAIIFNELSERPKSHTTEISESTTANPSQSKIASMHKDYRKSLPDNNMSRNRAQKGKEKQDTTGGCGCWR